MAWPFAYRFKTSIMPMNVVESAAGVDYNFRLIVAGRALAVFMRRDDLPALDHVDVEMPGKWMTYKPPQVSTMEKTFFTEKDVAASIPVALPSGSYTALNAGVRVCMSRVAHGTIFMELLME
jgi:hypothetical protein